MQGISKVPVLSLERFRSINGPIIDIRSPKEFTQGHWPGSRNIPIFNDKERELIGITYKQKGKIEATSIGIECILAKLSFIKDSLEDSVNRAKENYPSGNNLILRIYCWRGGMRSTSLVWLANKLGIKSVQLLGGYKSYRQWVLNQFQKDWPISLIGGRTGTGKTKLIISLAQKNIRTIDLEGLANHRGSSFGSLGMPSQPTSEHYENLIGESLETYSNNLNQTIWMEDESPNLGKCRIPKGLLEQMNKATVVEIRKSRDERITELVGVYGKYTQKDLTEATLRIKKRLGSERTKLALDAISKKDWPSVCEIVLDYYDKCYDFQLEKVKIKKPIDLSGLDHEEAATILIEKGIVS